MQKRECLDLPPGTIRLIAPLTLPLYFGQLESEAVEHAFAVYIDNEKRPSVQIYLVHNHPSGNLKPATDDMNIIEN